MPPQTETYNAVGRRGKPFALESPRNGFYPFNGWNALSGGLWPELRKRIKTSLFLGARFFVRDTEADRGIGKGNLHKALVPPAEVALSSSSEAARRGTAALY